MKLSKTPPPYAPDGMQFVPTFGTVEQTTPLRLRLVTVPGGKCLLVFDGVPPEDAEMVHVQLEGIVGQEILGVLVFAQYVELPDEAFQRAVEQAQALMKPSPEEAAELDDQVQRARDSYARLTVQLEQADRDRKNLALAMVDVLRIASDNIDNGSCKKIIQAIADVLAPEVGE
jgi:hypothetical protein